MAAPKYEWYAEEVNGTVADLTTKLNDLEAQSYEIFEVNGLLLPNAHGWVIIARKELPKTEEKKTPKEAKSLEAPPTEIAKVARGTVVLHKGHKK